MLNSTFKCFQRSFPTFHTFQRRFQSLDLDTGMRNIEKSMRGIMCYGPNGKNQVLPKYKQKYSNKEGYLVENDITTPKDLKSGEVLTKVLRVGICAGDTKCFDGADLFWAPGYFGSQYCEAPVCPGHEFVGEIIALGENCSDVNGRPLELGDQVVAEQLVPCGKCKFCLEGSPNMCHIHNIYGFRQNTPGAMATYQKYICGSRIHKVNKSVNPGESVYIEPLSCGIHASNRADIEFNDVVVISGAGAVGVGAIYAAKQKNPKKVIVLDMVDRKLEVAKLCGADEVFNLSNVKFSDLMGKIMEMTNNYGCDKYIELTGNNKSFSNGIQLLRRKGTLSLYSVFGRKIQTEDNIDLTLISDAKELTIKGGHLGPNCWETAVKWIENGVLPMKEIVTHCLKLEDFEKGFKLVKNGRESIKVTLDPQS